MTHVMTPAATRKVNRGKTLGNDPKYSGVFGP
jgi:hypothetical protein